MDGDAMPGSPYVDNIYGTSVRVNNLSYGETYHWFILSENQCFQDSSITQTFTLRDLPDLIVTAISNPDTVLSATSFEVDMTVLNQGAGSTSGTLWYDAIYISSDNSFSGDDRYLVQQVRKQALGPDSSYQQSISVSIPTEFAGNYFLFAVTDRNNNIAELDNSNNTVSSPGSILVLEKPLPDIRADHVSGDKNSYSPGDTIIVSWRVENIGDAEALGWTEKVSVVSLSGIRLDLVGTPAYSGSLEKGTSLDRSHIFILPDVINFSGEAYIEVELFPSPELQEYPGNELNNKGISAGRINIENKLYLTLPATVSEDYTGDVRCYIARSGIYTQALTVNLLASDAAQINLPASVTIPERSSSVAFNISMVDNAILEGNREIGITASASAFTSVADMLEILDNEKPTLSLSLDKNIANESDSLLLTLTRDLSSADSAIVFL